jgi:hypothetical protein
MGKHDVYGGIVRLLGFLVWGRSSREIAEWRGGVLLVENISVSFAIQSCIS